MRNDRTNNQEKKSCQEETEPDPMEKARVQAEASENAARVKTVAKAGDAARAKAPEPARAKAAEWDADGISNLHKPRTLVRG
jgi:hypothetical protein